MSDYQRAIHVLLTIVRKAWLQLVASSSPRAGDRCIDKESSMNRCDPQELIEEREQRLYETARRRLHTTIDRMFGGLMVLQWFLGMGLALFITPLTWIGGIAELHIHVWAAVVLGGIISSLPVYLVCFHPAATHTRHTIAVAQALWSALLIHLTGGRIETHFHVFGSLAFLAFYRDWRVLITASAVVAIDHFLRGVWWPQSVFGVVLASPYRWIEHAAWVVFEDIFLVASCVWGQREMREAARRQAQLEVTNATIEQQIAQRTEDLRRATEALEKANANLQQEADKLAATNTSLEKEIRQREKAERERMAAQQQLLEASRAAGMAEMATGVLHNVGNVLNSVNVSVEILLDQVGQSQLGNLEKAVDLLNAHRDDLAHFFTVDPRGPKWIEFLNRLKDRLNYEQSSWKAELVALSENVGHIKEIVAMQQNYARAGSVRTTVELPKLIDDAIKSMGSHFAEQGIELVRELDPLPPITSDKNKLLQILINLLSNARDAVKESDRVDKAINVSLHCSGHEMAVIEVSDNGIGIAKDKLTQIFRYGFTTKKKGHGFGLHSCALAAKELGGELTVHSEGPGKGATFRLKIPLFDGTSHQTLSADSKSSNDAAIAPAVTAEGAALPNITAATIDS
ncbi:MAG: hypothetical protein KatS3mg111_3435 [Pirellulaceae bacterium]|nr:MAG: hypothetical protein KatS3mg111_3435 [Pirellulaceae bacterium]